MSEGINRVTLLGNIGADPELRSLANHSVLNIRLATTEVFFDKNKVKQERTEWHRVAMWGPRAEALGRMLSKGERILVEGRLETRSWEKDGEKRYSTDIVATNIVMCGGSPRSVHRDAESVAHDDAPLDQPWEGQF